MNKHASQETAGRGQTPVVSVVVVNWNTRDLLRACLSSLPSNTGSLRIEAVVVDNGSSDGSPEMVAAEFPQAMLIRNSENVGFVRANNQGLEAATGEYRFMLNSDAEVREGCIERLVEVAENDRGIGAVGPRLLNSDGTDQESFGPFPRVLHRFFPSRFERAYCGRVERRMQETGNSIAPVDWLAGAALLCRRDVLERVGPLDERYRMWYDDIDWCRKLQRAGYTRVFVSDAVAMHHGRRSGGKIESQQLAEQLFDSEYTYLRLNEGRLATSAVFALRVGKALVSRLTARSEAARRDAAWRLGYHRRRFARFCLASVPPQMRRGV